MKTINILLLLLTLTACSQTKTTKFKPEQSFGEPGISISNGFFEKHMKHSDCSITFEVGGGVYPLKWKENDSAKQRIFRIFRHVGMAERFRRGKEDTTGYYELKNEYTHAIQNYDLNKIKWEHVEVSFRKRDSDGWIRDFDIYLPPRQFFTSPEIVRRLDSVDISQPKINKIGWVKDCDSTGSYCSLGGWAFDGTGVKPKYVHKSANPHKGENFLVANYSLKELKAIADRAFPSPNLPPLQPNKHHHKGNNRSDSNEN